MDKFKCPGSKINSTLKRQLKTGFKVVGEARDGDSALELIQNNKPI
jgi:YesN/AraC family two-component response regulator